MNCPMIMPCIEHAPLCDSCKAGATSPLPTPKRYLATYVFRPHDRPFTREVYASSREEALDAAKTWRAPYWKETSIPSVYVSTELHFSADHNGSTHGD